MFTKRQRHANPKEAILRGIYHDNLRITGKSSAAGRVVHHRLGWAQLGGIAAILLTLILGANEINRSHGPKEVTPSLIPSTIPEAGAGSLGPIVPPGHGLPPVESGDASLLAQIPIWDFTASSDQHLEDYRLLLSGDDQVRLSAIFGLEVKTIVIDPGHGGHDPGAIGTLGTKEKDITLDVALRLRDRLIKMGHYNVLLTRDGDQTLSLAGRVEFGKQHKTDLFISVHVNSLPDQRLHVIETYYFGPPLNSETLRLAEQENKESGYALGEIDAIVEDIGSTVKRQESARLAAAIQTSLFRNVQSHDALVRDLGIKMAPFVVLSKVEVPSVLVEISCLTKETEEAKLMSPAYREKVAAYMEEGIVAYLDINHAIALHGEK
ncbi:MAG: N-acetylmuramoyl-L-alanine amidase [Desulfatitalea sp.]|nr:N-acetylmuramoyl-L-alanine amidase [Desulfatitalea sp.]